MIQAVILGLGAGVGYAGLGVCVVLLTRMVGVVNFAQAAIGALGWFVLVVLHQHGLPYGWAALVGVIAGAAAAVLMGLMMTWLFAESDVRTRSTVCIAVLIAMLTLGFLAFGEKPRPNPTELTGSLFSLGGVGVTQGTVFGLVGSIVLAVSVSVVLHRTRLGIQLRALSERPITAELLGIRSKFLALSVWGVSGIVAVLAMLIVGSQHNADFGTLAMLITPAFAAALFGLFRNLYLTVVGGLLIGVITVVSTQYPALDTYHDAIPLVFIVIAMLWSQRAEVWDEAR